jgi:GNAT superfamily N-acetyltransferase
MCFTLRRAVLQDISSLSELIHESVRQLLLGDYSDQQIEAALLGVFGVDSQLIADGTYFAATPKHGPQIVVGCGGWSRRKTLFGGDGWSAREDRLLEPGRDAARIRAFFVHPQWSRRGIASSILEACEL